MFEKLDIIKQNIALQKQVDELTSKNNLYKDTCGEVNETLYIENIALQKQVDELKEKEKTIIYDFNKELKTLLMLLKIEQSKLTTAIEGFEEIANKTCETGCRFDDEDCTPENCIIREWKDLAQEYKKKLEEQTNEL